MSRLNAACAADVAEQVLVRRWAAGDPAAVQQVTQLLASVKLTMDHVAAKAAARHLDTIERFNRMIANTEWRRDRLLQEIERHRSGFAKNLARKVEQIEEAEFKTVEADTKTNNAQAEEARAAEAKTAEVEAARVQVIEAKAGEAQTEVAGGDAPCGELNMGKTAAAVEAMEPCDTDQDGTFKDRTFEGDGVGDAADNDAVEEKTAKERGS